VWNGYGVCSNLASSGEPPASHDHFNHCARPTVTSSALRRHQCIHCLVTEGHVCEQLAQGCTRKRSSREWNPRPVGRNSRDPTLRRWATHTLIGNRNQEWRQLQLNYKIYSLFVVLRVAYNASEIKISINQKQSETTNLRQSGLYPAKFVEESILTMVKIPSTNSWTRIVIRISTKSVQNRKVFAS